MFMNKIVCKLLLCCVSTSLCLCVFSQRMSLRTWEQIPLVGINAVIQDKEGYIWYATTEGGLCRDNGYQVDIFRNDRANTHRMGHSNGVLSVCETANGDICFGTRENIYLLRKADYTIIPLDTTVARGKVTSISLASNGDIVAMTGSGLCRFGKNGKRIMATPASIHGALPRQSSVMTDRYGRQWGIENSQPYIVPARESAIRKIPSHTVYDVKGMKRATDRTGLLYKGDSDGITISDIYSGQTLHRIDGLSNIRQIVPCNAGGAYFISAHDALALCKGNGTVTSLVKGGESKTLTIAKDGSVWIGGWHGEIWRYDARQRKLILDEVASIANSDPVNGIASDRYGRLWILTDREVKTYDIHTHLCNFFTSKNPMVGINKFENITIQDDNIVIYGTDGNISISANAHWQHPKVRISLTNTVIDDIAHPMPPNTNEVEIPSSATSVSLFFSTFDHVNAGDIVFSYRINGGEWHKLPIGDNHISFIKLHKGDYSIDVRTTGTDCQYGGSASFMLHRLPAWWETWWAYTIYIILCVGIVITIERCYIKFRNTRRKLSELQERLDTFLRDRTQNVNTLSETITINEADREFIAKAVSMVEQHLDDSDYDVTQFAGDLCMSRATLYRMFADTTGQKPLAFMRSIRLKHAEEMLRDNKDMSVQQVATITGFASVSNFTRRFKDMFGMNPGDIR